MERDIREAATVDFLERILFPTLDSRLDKAFPVYGFRRDTQGRWIATRRPASLPDPLRKSAHLYGDRRGIRGLDPEHAFLPWLMHESTHEARGSAKSFHTAVARLASACGVPLPDDIVKDASFARRQRLEDVREAAWACLRAFALRGLPEELDARLADVGLARACRDASAESIGYCPSLGELESALGQAVGASEKELYAIGLTGERLQGALCLGIRDASGTFQDLVLVDPDPAVLCESLRARVEDDGAGPRVFGLDVALAEKGGPEDLLVVRDPLSAFALQSRGTRAVAGLLVPSIDGAVWDEIVSAGVRGVRFLVPGAEKALRRVATTLSEDQLRRLRLRCLEEGHEALAPGNKLGARAAEIGAAVLAEELRRLPWRDPRTSEASELLEPELLIEQASEAAPAPPASNGTRETQVQRFARKHRTRARADEARKSTLGDASRFVRASRGWEEARAAAAASAAPTDADERPAPVAEAESAEPSSPPRAAEHSADRAGRTDAAEAAAPASLPRAASWRTPSLPALEERGLAGRLWLHVDAGVAGLDLVWQLCSEALGEGDDVLELRFENAGSRGLAERWVARHEAHAPRVRFSEGGSANGAGARVVCVERNAAADEAPEPAGGARVLYLSTGPGPLPARSAQLADVVLELRPFAHERLARFFGRKPDEVFLDDHLARCAREGRSFFELRVRGKCAPGSWSQSMTHEEGSARFFEGALPYRF